MQRITILFAVLSLVLPGVASAKLYKCKDAEGQVVYTDQACEGEGEELKLPPSVTYTPKTIPETASSPEEEVKADYKTLEMVTPENDTLIRSTKGEVIFLYKITGPLLTVKGHKYGLELDGIKLEARGITNQVRLNNINPGTHTIRVFVVDKDDKELISSAISKFHMRRQEKSGTPTPGDVPLESVPGLGDAIDRDPEGGDDSLDSGGLPPGIDTVEGDDSAENEDENEGLIGGGSTIPGSENTIPGGLGTIPGGRR